MKSLKPLGKSSYIPLEKALRELDNYKPEEGSMGANPNTTGEASGNGNSSLEDKADFWSIDNVPYRNGIYRVDLAKKLLDSGSAKTQDEWAEYSKQAKQQGNFYVGDFPLYYALSSQLHSLRDNTGMKDIAEEARKFISKQMFEKWLITLTRLRYKANGNDVIVHNYRVQEQYEVQGEATGPDGFITSTDTNAQSMLELLTGESDVAKVNEVYKWITGKGSYLLRVNSKQDTERIARFFANCGRSYLDCNRNPGGSYSALGVRLARRVAP